MGLRDAIIELINSFGILKNPVFNVKVYNGSDPANLQYEQKIMVYRIIQELCNNTFKYAKASLVELNITHSKNKLNLHYKDNGKGFDPIKNKKGIGLRSILSRVEYYEGKFELNTSLNKGTEVMINLPLD